MILLQQERKKVSSFYRAMLHYVFFGFARYFFDKTIPSGSRTYAYLPSQRDEDTDERITPEQVRAKIGGDAVITTWEYDRTRFLEQLASHPHIPRFNKHLQQHYRMLSMYYHIQQSLAMLDSVTLAPDDVIVLTRLDNGLIDTDVPTILALLRDHDVIVEFITGELAVNDHYFVMRPPAVKSNLPNLQCHVPRAHEIPA